MCQIFPKLNFFVKDRLLKVLRKCRSRLLHVHILIILNLNRKRSARLTASVLGVHNTTVYRVARRFAALGIWGLFDGRSDNGSVKLDERFLDTLNTLVRSTPQQYGWKRATWTRELLVKTMEKKCGVRIHVATMSRALDIIRARRGRPRPTVKCPWSEKAKKQRLAKIRRLLDNLPKDHAAFYEDEVDIHLNPKIGLDWMGYGQQKEVPTPGTNVKRYIAGAMDVRTGQITWVEGEKKRSLLFVELLHKLIEHNPQAKVIHLIVDNFSIHTSKRVQAVLVALEGKIQLHFLPPYCPQHNRIERVWLDLHANVTRNHKYKAIHGLMNAVRSFLYKWNMKHMCFA